jgi:beta-glucosidase
MSKPSKPVPVSTLLPLVLMILAAACSTTTPLERMQIPQHFATTPAPPNGEYEMGLHESFNKFGESDNVEVVFLGDSITWGWTRTGRKVWDQYYGHRQAVNFGVGGDKTGQVLWRIDHGNFDNISPKLIVLLIGINNGANNTAPEIAEGVAAVIQRLRRKLPRSRILVLGIFPFGANSYRNHANPIIAGYADGRMIHYLNIDEAFLDEDGKIDPGLMPDGLHLSEAGYQAWAEAIEPKMAELLGDK